MRMMMKAVVEDIEAGNEAIRNGSVQQLLQKTLDQLKPEAVYFVDENGYRSFIAVFDMADPSDLVTISEPIYQAIKARISISPCMNLEDLQKGLSRLTS